MSAPPNPPLIEAHDLAFRWPGHREIAVSLRKLRLAQGEHLFVSGPSGSGKSTLLSLLAGVLTPSQGDIAIAGTSMRALSPSQRDRFRGDHIGIIFQQLNLLPYLSVLDNVLLGCRFSKRRTERTLAQAGHTPRGTPRDAAAMLLERLDMPAALWRRPGSALSVGQQQRVAAARALIGRPELILADEPTSALDANRQAAFMELLRRECRASGAGLVFVSHDERLAQEFDRCLTMPTAVQGQAA